MAGDLLSISVRVYWKGMNLKKKGECKNKALKYNARSECSKKKKTKESKKR